MIETKIRFEFQNIKGNDDQIFFVENGGWKILAIADGVTNCSKGRIASATICFALHKYFTQNPITANLVEYVNTAIDDSVNELKEVTQLFEDYFDIVLYRTEYSETVIHDAEIPSKTTQTKIDKATALKETVENPEINSLLRKNIGPQKTGAEERTNVGKAPKKGTSTSNGMYKEITDSPESDPLAYKVLYPYIGGEKKKLEQESNLNKKDIEANDSRIELNSNSENAIHQPPFVITDLESKLIEIFSFLQDFNKEEYDDAKHFVSNLLCSVSKIEDGSFSFQTTLSLNILKNENEFINLNSFNFGDSELLVISLEPDTISIDSQISHYRLHQGDLKSFISSSKGRNGRLDISTRKLYKNDLLLIGTDGTNFAKTAKKSGNPFSPLHNLIIDCFRKNKLDLLPTLWFEKLRSIDGLDDDFSMFSVYCNNSVSE